MSQTIVELNCPGCGARVSSGQDECIYCHKPIVISSFNSVYAMPASEINKYASSYRNALAQDPDNQQINAAIAMCYLKLKLYDKALAAFEKAIEDNFDNSETFFYAAVCLLRGQKAFNTPMNDIKTALRYIDAALMIEPRGIYHYFLAYIKCDFYERKCLNISPSYREELALAQSCHVTGADIALLFDLIGKSIPEEIRM